MVYPNAQIPLIAEPFHRGRNDRACHRGHFCCAKARVSRRKSVMPLRLLSNHQGLSVLPIFDNSATFVENRSFQTVPRRKIAMNTLTERHDIYPSRHARAILMCLTLLNSFNHMKSFTMFTFSWLKFVKKRGTSIYLLRVYVMPSILCIHFTFLLWHNLGRHIFYKDSRIIGINSIDKP